MADKVLRVIPNVGEVGIDTNASPGNGPYYVKSYIVEYDVCGFDSLEEALMELEFVGAELA